MVLNYHELTEEPSEYLYTLGTPEFERHLAVFSEIRSNPGSGIVVPTLTFDDGHVSHYERAMPWLDRLGLLGHFCVTAAWTDRRCEYMTGAQLRELSAHGHEILAHGWTHKHLTGCTEPELETELVKAKKSLEDTLGKEVDGLSFPGGRWDNRVLRACSDAGYTRAYCSEPWWLHRSQHGLSMRGRYTVTRQTSAVSLKRILAERQVDRMRQGLAHYTKSGLKAVVGDSAYHWIWCRYSGFLNKTEASTSSAKAATTE